MMNSMSCSYNSASQDRTWISVNDELDKLFIQLGESDVDSVDVHLEGKLVESLPNSMSRDGYEV